MNYSPSCRSSLEHKLRYFLWNLRAFWRCIDSNATDTFKVQKPSKEDIDKIVHVTSVVHQQFLLFVSVFDVRSWEYHDAWVWCCWCRSRCSDVGHPSLLVHRLYILIQVRKTGQNIASHPLYWKLQTCLRRHIQHFMYSMCLPLLVNNVQRVWVLRQNAGSCVSSIKLVHRGTLMNMHRRLTWQRRNCWIKSLFLFSLCTKYSRSFIKLRLNHWCHMDYFNDVLTTFLGLERSSCFAVYAGSESSRIPSKNINSISITCVLKMDEGLMGLERHEGE